MKLTTKMFIALVLTVAMMAGLQYTLIQAEKSRVKKYAASFGGTVAGGGLDLFKKTPAAQPQKYIHENFYCGKNICSFTVSKKNYFLKPIMILVDKTTLAEECLSPDTKAPGDICRQFKAAGWDIIRARD